MEKEKVKEIGELSFWYDDYTEDRCNESVRCSYPLWGVPGEGLNIETYYRYCRQFAAAIGFGEATINKWFGDY